VGPALRAFEAGQRKLVGAIAALEALCRRFQGFGIEQAIPEQTAALGALGRIGGSEAARAVRRIIVGRIVQGPGLSSAKRQSSRAPVTRNASWPSRSRTGRSSAAPSACGGTAKFHPSRRKSHNRHRRATPPGFRPPACKA